MRAFGFRRVQRFLVAADNADEADTCLRKRSDDGGRNGASSSCDDRILSLERELGTRWVNGRVCGMVIPFQGTKSAIDSTPSTLSEAKRSKSKPRERRETNELVPCDTTDCRFDLDVSPDYKAENVQDRPSLLMSPGPFKSHRPSSLARLPVGLKFQQFGLHRRPQFDLNICPSWDELHHIMTSPQTSSNVCMCAPDLHLPYPSLVQP